MASIDDINGTIFPKDYFLILIIKIKQVKILISKSIQLQNTPVGDGYNLYK